MGWKLLHKETEDKADLTSLESRGTCPTSDSLKGKVFYPSTFPLTADPACIVVMITERPCVR
jgi:hypothetical protein